MKKTQSILLATALCVSLVSCVSRSDRDMDTYVGPERPVAIANTFPVNPGARAGETNAIEVAVEDAILMALENNQALKLERLSPQIQKTFEAQERATFDPTLTADLAGGKTKEEQIGSSDSGVQTSEVDTIAGDVSVNEFLPTGTKIAVAATANGQDSPAFANDFNSVRAGVSLTQSLLQGGSVAANLASLRQAKLDTLASEYELRGFAQTLVASVEESYWNYALAQRQLDIFSNSLKLAEDQLKETEERINIGALARVERAAAQAEVASRKEGLIDARSALETSRLQMLRLLNPPGTNPWDRTVLTEDPPRVPDGPLDDISSHVQLALRMRPELNQARLNIRHGDLEIVKTRNGLLPVLDLFIRLGSTGYADSFGAAANQVDGSFYDAMAGIRFQYPLGNRDVRARHERALLGLDQAVEAMNNLSREQMTATAATRKYQEETVRSETEKFRVGKSTTLLVAQAERDLLVSRLAETQAVANHLKALVQLYRLDGSLLERRGIQAPGGEPVALSEERK
jgi:outer membrane protein TolC